MQDDNMSRTGLWSFLTETRFGSTTPLGCLIQMLLTGVVTAVLFWLVLTLA